MNKPKLCIALPGINYTPQSPYVLSTLPVAEQLRKDFEITLVYRSMLTDHQHDFNYQTILPSGVGESPKSGYFAPVDLLSYIDYYRAMRRFALAVQGQFDILIEKEWRLLGALAHAFRSVETNPHFKTVAIAEANFISQMPPQIPLWRGNPVKKLSRLGYHHLLPTLRKHLLSSFDRVIAETVELKDYWLEKGYFNRPTDVYPAENGVNFDRFFPKDRHHCRQALGIEHDAIVMVYVGSLSASIQNPALLLAAMADHPIEKFEFHVVGKGSQLSELRRFTVSHGLKVHFHGHVPQTAVPDYIGAANVCLAPYDLSKFIDGCFTSASLKISEYLACGRPVVSTPCSRVSTLLDGGKYGFLVEYSQAAYGQFLADLPNQSADISALEAQLLVDLDQGILREKGSVVPWQDIANKYQAALLPLVSNTPEKMITSSVTLA